MPAASMHDHHRLRGTPSTSLGGSHSHHMLPLLGPVMVGEGDTAPHTRQAAVLGPHKLLRATGGNNRPLHPKAPLTCPLPVHSPRLTPRA
jgi:hypothetical protein